MCVESAKAVKTSLANDFGYVTEKTVSAAFILNVYIALQENEKRFIVHAVPRASNARSSGSEGN